MPILTPLFTLLAAVAAGVLTILGVTDAALAAQVQAMIAAAGGLIVAVSIYCHHASKQNADAVSVAAAQAANQATQLAQAVQAGRHTAPVPVSPPVALASPSLVAAVGSMLDARTGQLATAPAVIPAPAGPTLPPPPAWPMTASTPGSADDYPTEQISAIASVPAR